MEITINLIKELREKTGAGMTDCKKALIETNGDLIKAVDFLRKKGAATASKRADKAAKEGAIKSAFSADGKHASIIELNCETDFVSKGDDFQSFAQSIADATLLILSNVKEDVLKYKGPDGLTVEDNLNGMMGRVGEKVELRRVKSLSIDSGFITGYIHFGSKLGSLIVIKGNGGPEAVELGKKIAMQVVAMNPLALNREGISKDLIENEKEIYSSQARNEKKPDNIVERIVNNKVEKFYQENCLVEQEFIQEANTSVGDLIKKFNKDKGESLEIVEYARFQLGQD
jgi:elongation factor Ts